MIADERVTWAYLEVVRRVLIFVRSRSFGEHRLADEHLNDLMDAIHNVPDFLAGDNAYYTPALMRDFYFSRYDAEWSDQGGLRLVSILDEALSQAD